MYLKNVFIYFQINFSVNTGVGQSLNDLSNRITLCLKGLKCIGFIFMLQTKKIFKKNCKIQMIKFSWVEFGWLTNPYSCSDTVKMI